MKYILNKAFFAILLTLLWLAPLCAARSPFRKQDPTTPSIEVRWEHEKKSYRLSDSHLEEYAVFKTFDESFFNEHLLPHNAITYRNHETLSVKGDILQKLVDELIDEIYAGKKNFKHFTVLRSRDFNRSECIGLMVLKFNDYPFVLKLFMESPKSITSPYSKGLVPLFTFYMGGGINRHLIGFTRIKNLEYMKKKISSLPDWCDIVDFPRKWYLLPKKSRWMHITGKNIGGKEYVQSRLPGTYCIIADAIVSDKKMSMLNKLDNNTVMKLCGDLNFWIDPHIDNFMWEKNTNKLVIIDTEHFPTLMGFRENQHYESYLGWLGHLSGKFLHDAFFRSKQDRKLAQLQQRVVL